TSAGVNTVSPAYSSTVLADQPAGYWRLGEASGTAASDSSGNGNGGAIGGGVTLGAAGALTADTNTAMQFDGTSGAVEVPSSTSLSPTVAVTMEAWIYSSTGGTGSWQGIVAKRSGGDYGYGMSF